MLKISLPDGKLFPDKEEWQVFTVVDLTFQDVMNFYPSNNKAVYTELKSAVQSGSLTPFVGAGLSVFCGYKLWPDVLKELAGFIPDDEPREAALEMIRQNEFLDAAEHIHKHYRPMMRRLLGLVNYSKIDDCPDDRLYSSAAWVLPKLFGSRPMMTTNFDGVLEYVFAKQNRSFERIVEPCDPSILNQVRQKDAHGLFKLHGDIGRETTSMDRLVFTRTQYDNVYKGDLIDELKQWYQNQTLLFLGCSLAMDKTMEVLRTVVEKHPAIRHFAIVACKSDQRSDLLDQFADLGIDAIFYDDSNHDAVRIILENLLYETDQDAYQQFDEEMCRFVGPVRRDDVLMYNAGRIKYVGRKDELSALEQFCESASTNSWWAVTGPGGMGKSRLVYEFTNAKQEDGWKVRWFSRDQYDQLDEYQLPAENTIVVLDDVQADIQTVGNWLKSMRQHRRRNRLRILLVERDGKDFASADWLRLLRSGTPYSDPLARWCHNQTFLHLQPLGDDDLKDIMTDCANALGNLVDPDALLTALIRVDKKLRRPLYALAVAEAVCRGEDPIHWTSEQILDEMLDRELTFHYESLQYIIGTVPTHTEQQELELLMAHCCVRGHLRLDEVTQELYPCLSNWMERRAPREFFRCLGLLQAEGDREVLRMNCPDLIREHLVLRLALDEGRMELLLPENWQEDVVQIYFLRQILNHQQKRLLDITHLWKTVMQTNPTDSDACTQYAGLLWDLTYFSPEYCATATEHLEQLYLASPDNPRIRTAFAAGICNNSIGKPLEYRMASVQKLTALHDKYPEDRDAAYGLANGLSILSSMQNLDDCSNTVIQLTQLSKTYPNDKAFSLMLARGLRNLAYVHNLEGHMDAVTQLTQLAETFPGDRLFLLELAIALRFLAHKQDLTLCSETVDQLTRISESFAGDRNFSLELAIALRHLAFKQDSKSCDETVDRLTKICEAFPGDKDFTLELSIALRHSTFKHGLAGCNAAVYRLAKISESFPNDRDFDLELAIALRNLAYEQDLDACIGTVKRLTLLANTYPNDREFSLQLAIGLKHLAYKQTSDDCANTVMQLANIADTFSGDRDFSLELAMGLRCLAYEQDLNDGTDTIKHLTQLADAFPGDRDFLLELAIGLRCLSSEQVLSDRTETVKRLTQLTEDFPGDRDFALQLAISLRNLTHSADAATCTQAVDKLEQLYVSYPGDESFAEELACALVNLALAQNTEEDVRNSLAKSEKIRTTYPAHASIQQSHAMTWFNLTLVQQESNIPATLSDICSFLRTHPDIIPPYKEALNQYLSEHPDHTERYRPLLEL